MGITLSPGQFYGKTDTLRFVAGLKLREATYPSGLRLPKHRHESACFSLMLQGALTEHYATRVLESEPWTVCFNAADEEHSNFIHNKGARVFIVEMSEDWMRRRFEHPHTFRKSTVFEGGDLNWLSLRLYREFRRPDESSSIAIEGLALEMIAALARRNSTREKKVPPWLTEARDLVHAQFLESLTVSAIAKTVGVHPVHLARSFRANFDSSIGDYIRKLRIQFACEQISSTDLPLAQIAVKAGFYDQGHLSRLFKRSTGMTPAQYRSIAGSGRLNN